MKKGAGSSLIFQTKNIKVKVNCRPEGLVFNDTLKMKLLVGEGACYVKYANKNNIEEIKEKVEYIDHYIVQIKDWHQIVNPFKSLHMMKFNGNECVEEILKDFKKIFTSFNKCIVYNTSHNKGWIAGGYATTCKAVHRFDSDSASKY